jgi:peptidase S41-like protein
MTKDAATVVVLRVVIAAALCGCSRVNPSPSPSLVGNQVSGARLDSTSVVRVVERLALVLDSLYVEPDRGARFAKGLRDRLRLGAYYRIATPRELADSLSADLSASAHDLHLWVRYFPSTPSGAGGGVNLDDTWLNYGFPEVRILDGNVGYVNIRSFSPGPAAERAARAAISLLIHCDALVIDLRRNGGGSTPAMMYVASHLFANRVHLTSLYWRNTGDTIRAWTQPSADTALQLTRQRTFVIVSRQTFSAAEDFAYSLQASGRATVVGETTRGGAHSAQGLQDLGFDIKALIPSGKSLNPITGTNWEGAGVTPDIAAPASAALHVAYRGALEQLVRMAPAGPRRERLQRALSAINGAALPNDR